MESLPLNLMLVVFRYLPIDEVVHGPYRATSRYLQQCSEAYLGTLQEIVVRPGFRAKTTATAPRLQSLIIATNRASSCVDDSLRLLVRDCPRLVRIAFESGSVISASTLEILQKGCPKVVSIAMPSCNVTDDHLRVVSRFRDLQRLDLSGCDRLTDAGIRHLARGCTKLQALVLSGCPKISDNALELLTDHCPLTSSPRSAGQRPFEHLQTLDLSETDISDSGVDLVRSRCPHIEQFVANHCYRLSVYPNLYEMFATSCAFQPAA